MHKDDLITGVYPQFFPASWLANPGIAFSPFPSSIRIGYVLRLETGYSYIMQEELESIGLSLDEMHSVALNNLAKLPGAAISIAKVPGGSEGWIAASDDNFTAVRILLPSAQREFCSAIGEEFFVAIACRDDCFCWSMSQSSDRQEKHMRTAIETFTTDEYNLTPDIFKFRNGTLELYRQQKFE